MNSDISYNSRRDNEASILKTGILMRLKLIAEKLGVEVPDVKPEPTLCEENTWLARLNDKLECMLNQNP